MNNTLIYLVEQEWSYIHERVVKKQTFTEKLTTFIEASLAYQITNRTNNIALVEIIFNARTPDHIPYYLLEDDEDLKNSLLQNILLQGQESKEFKDFHPQVIATVIQGAISESLLSPQKQLSLENFSAELIKTILEMVK